MSVNYAPIQNTYKDMGAFRFWCQKMLPLVYDDSLSYYELLCKVVNYLNDVIDNVNNIGKDTTNLFVAYNQLQTWVNDYFDNLDVQEEINAKLDKFANDGTLYNMIKPMFDVYTETVDIKIEKQNRDIEALNARISMFTSLQEGSTTGDAELLDGRVSYNGVTYPTIGDAIRGQYRETANELSSIENDIYTSALELIPSDVSGNYKFVNNGGALYVGTHNVISLLNLAQGEFNFNGLSIAVNGSTFTVVGSSETAVYFNPTTGANASISSLMEENRNLPEHTYTLISTISKGTYVPNTQIRAKGGGNIAAAQGNATTFEYNYSSCGQLYIYLQPNVEYNVEFSLALMPYTTTYANPHKLENSVVYKYLYSGVSELHGYAWYTGDVKLYKLTLKDSNLKCFVKYFGESIDYTGATEYLEIYTPNSSGWLCTTLGHCISDTSNADIWRIIKFSSLDKDMANRFDITRYGETEMALQIVGRDDFIGGWTHGDEITVPNSFTILLDGKRVNPTSLGVGAFFDTMRIIEATTMYDPANHIDIVGEHGKEYIITLDGIVINQTVRWSSSYTLKGSYMPMLCAIRGNDKVSNMQITDSYFDDGDYKTYDVGVAGFTNYPNKPKTNVRKMNLYSAISGVDASVEIFETPELTGRGVFVYNGADSYNKIYCGVCGVTANYTTSPNELWKVRAKICINV